MVDIVSIVEQVMSTRVLTSRQQHQIDVLLKHGRYQTEDLDALERLMNAIASRMIVTGGNSLVPLMSA